MPGVSNEFPVVGQGPLPDMDWSRPARSPVPTSLSRSVTGRVSTKSRGCPFMMLLSTALAALLMPSSRVCNRALQSSNLLQLQL